MTQILTHTPFKVKWSKFWHITNLIFDMILSNVTFFYKQWIINIIKWAFRVLQPFYTLKLYTSNGIEEIVQISHFKQQKKIVNVIIIWVLSYQYYKPN